MLTATGTSTCSDRTNWKFLSGAPFVYTNWNAGFDAKGRPSHFPGSNSSRSGSFFVYPTVGGATNFQAPAYSPATGWMYLAYSENGVELQDFPGFVDRRRPRHGRGRRFCCRARRQSRRAGWQDGQASLARTDRRQHGCLAQ